MYFNKLESWLSAKVEQFKASKLLEFFNIFCVYVGLLLIATLVLAPFTAIPMVTPLLIASGVILFFAIKFQHSYTRTLSFMLIIGSAGLTSTLVVYIFTFAAFLTIDEDKKREAETQKAKAQE